MSPAENLKRLSIELPKPAVAVANYVPWVKSGKLIFVSGQLPMLNGKLAQTGQLTSVAAGAEAAKIAAINILAHLNDATQGDLNKIARIVKITGFVSCAADFADHAKVVNGASDLFVEVFAEKGRHARSSVGVSSLPLGASVEVEAIAELE